MGVGLLALSGGAAGMGCFARHHWKRSPNLVEVNATELEAQPPRPDALAYPGMGGTVREPKGRTVIQCPNGHRYILCNTITLEEAERLRTQTGIEVPFAEGKRKSKFVLGQGQFGKLRLALAEETSQFVGVKKIKGKAAIEKSLHEGRVQQQLSHLPHVMPLLDAVESTGSEGERVLYQFMPLAGFGNGTTLRDLLAACDDAHIKEAVLLHVAQGLVTAVCALHQAGFYHMDLKPDNMVLNLQGGVYLIDFGCTRVFGQGQCQISDGGDGDVRYYAPERLAHFRHHWQAAGRTIEPATETTPIYAASGAGTWALGVTLLELTLGHHPFLEPNCDTDFFWHLNQCDSGYFRQRLMEIPELQQPHPRSLGYVIHCLLEPDPTLRLTLDEVKDLPVLKRATFTSHEAQAATFTALAVGSDIQAVIATSLDGAHQDTHYPRYYMERQSDTAVPALAQRQGMETVQESQPLYEPMPLRPRY